MTIYEFAYGEAGTEQDAVSALNDFVVNTLGWTLVDTVSDTSSDRDYVWSSTGEAGWVASGGDPFYVRARAVSDVWQLHGYRTYVDTGTNTFEIYNNSGTHVDLSSSVLKYWFYGNLDFVCCNFYDPSTVEPVTCYMGFIDSYYDITRDDFPLLIKGCQVQSYTWIDTENTYMHNCTTSGVQTHENVDWWNFLQYDIGYTDGNTVVMLPVIVRNLNASNIEVRGEVKGVYQVNGNRFPVFGSMATASGIFLVFKSNSDESACHAYGPVYTNDLNSFDMWNGDLWVSGEKVV